MEAWKSGKNPSAIKLAKSNKKPKIYVFLPLLLLKSVYGSNNLNIIIPSETPIATKIFLGPNFNFLSLTLEHITLTKITGIILQDLTIIVNGKLTM